MAKQSGFDIAVLMDITGGTPALIGGATNSRLSINGNPIEANDRDGSRWRELVKGIRSWSLAGSGFVKEEDTKFDLLQDKALDGATLDVSFSNTGNATPDVYTGSVLIGTFERGGDVDGIETYDYTLEGSGTLSKA